ncbi:hypothetical protein K439DRAFT_1627394 [Ramaria rubella]|nr:hypothetical protein K439DRAFT_1627394 [Ramaria rubella]
MSTSNSSLLTRSHAVYSAKKRARKAQIQEVVFDDDARREYLTGFRKRNLLKKETKRKNAQERERLEKLELRKQHRKELAERAAQNVREVEGAFGMFPGDVITNSDVRTHDGEAQLEEELEFEDEEQLAVVTVVEDFAADSLRHPEPLKQSDSGQRHPEGPREKGAASPATPKLRLKAKSNKVHYETKAARKMEKTKQRARKTEKAERAGSKKKRGTKR